MPTQPEITAPVSRGRDASTGIIQNIGTAKGATGANVAGIGGVVNNSTGGSSDNGTTSFQNSPENPSAYVKNIESGGGSSKAVSTSSLNPQSIQDESSIEATHSEYQARNTEVVDAASAGNYATRKRSNLTPELPSRDSSAVRETSPTMGGNQAGTADNGVETSMTFGSVNDIDRITNDADVLKAPGKGEASGKRLDGAKEIGDPTKQDRDELRQNKVSPNFPANKDA